MTGKILFCVLALVLLIAVAAGLDPLRQGSRLTAVERLAPIKVDEGAAATRSNEAVRLKTTSSRDDANLDAEQFRALPSLPATELPGIHADPKPETVGELNPLHARDGADPTALPIMPMTQQQATAGAESSEEQGVRQDEIEALLLFRLAAAQGNLNARYNLGVLLAEGEGVAQDYVRGYMWMHLAAAVGHASAWSSRDTIARRMTAQQIAQAQEMASECEAREFKDCD